MNTNMTSNLRNSDENSPFMGHDGDASELINRPISISGKSLPLTEVVDMCEISPMSWSSHGKFIHINKSPSSPTSRYESITINTEDIDDNNDLSYAINAYTATSKPVAIAMILTSLSVMFVKTDLLGKNQELNVYQISDDDSVSYSRKFEESMINAFVIVIFVCLMTFAMVFLFYLRCTSFIKAYIVFSSTVLFGFLGGFYFLAVVDMLRIPMDIFTFLFFLYNFAAVGVKSIFYPEGIPRFLTQVTAFI